VLVEVIVCVSRAHSVTTLGLCDFRFIETSLDSDLRHKLSEECFELSLTHQTPPLACQVGYLRNMGLDILSM